MNISYKGESWKIMQPNTYMMIWKIYQSIMIFVMIFLIVFIDIPLWVDFIILIFCIFNLPFLKIFYFSDLVAMFFNGISFILVAIFGKDLAVGWVVLFSILGGIRILFILIYFTYLFILFINKTYFRGRKGEL